MKRWTALACLFVSALMIGNGYAQEFSADVVDTVTGAAPKLNRSEAGKIYVSGRLVRLELPDTPINIFEPDAFWLLDPKLKTYSRTEPDPRIVHFMLPGSIDALCRSMPAAGETCTMTTRRTILGREAVGFSVVDADGGSTKGWIDVKWGVLLKLIDSNTRNGRVEKIELRHIKEGKQPESLFKVPDDYRQVAEP